MRIQPLHDHLIVERIEEPEKIGEIYIPEVAKPKSSRARVISKGPGRVDDNGKVKPMTVQVGDVIVFSKFTGEPTVIDGRDFLIMREADVIGVEVQD